MKINYIIFFLLLITTANAQRKIIGKYDSKQKTFITKDKSYWIGDMSNGYAVISRNGYYGLMDSLGKIIFKPKYDEVHHVGEGYCRVRKNEKYGMVNNSGKEYVPLIYGQIYYLSKNAILCSKHNVYENNDQLEITDRTFKHKKEFNYSLDHPSFFSISDGFICVTQNQKYGFMATDGKLIIPCKYDKPSLFKNGFATVQLNGKKGFINKWGKEIMTDYSLIFDFEKGYAKVLYNKMYGMIDTTGWLIIPCIYQEVQNYSEGLIACKKNDKCGFVNLEGREVIPFLYDATSDFLNGAAIIKNKERSEYGTMDLYSIIAQSGEEVIPVKYQYIYYSNEGLWYALKGYKQYVILDSTWHESEVYETVHNEERGFLVKKGGKYGFMDAKGLLVIPHKYDYINGFFDNLSVARIDSIIYKHKQMDVNEHSNELFNNPDYTINIPKYGVIDRTGYTVAPFIYDEISMSSSEGLFNALKNGKWGFFDKTGKEIIPFIYDETAPFSTDGKSKVKLNGEFFNINKEGKRVD